MIFRDYLRTKTGRRSTRAVGIFISFYCGLLVFTFLSQERLVYLPSNTDFNNCQTVKPFGLTPQSFNGTRFYGPPVFSSSTSLVVVYHGNAGSACDRAYYLPAIVGSGAEVILVEYSGYSNDPKPPKHDRIKQDVQKIAALIDALDIKNVTVLGESIGTGPAILHAKLSTPNNLVLITPFTNLKDLARHHYWYFPTNLLVNDAFNNKRDLADYTGPRSIIHGREDSIVPYFMSEELAKVNQSQTTLHTIEAAGHNNLIAFPEFNTVLLTSLTATAKEELPGDS